MRRIISAFVIGATVVACCVFWLTRRLRHTLEDSHTNEAIPPSAPVPSPPNPPHPSLDEKERDLPRAPNKTDWIIASLLLGISLCLVITWSYNLITNLSSLSMAPKVDELTKTVPTLSDSIPDQGVSTVPNGLLIASTSPKAHGILTFTISQIKNETPTAATLSGTLSLAIPFALQAVICDDMGIPNGSKCPGNSLVATQQSVSMCMFTPGRPEIGSGQMESTRKTIYLLKQKYASKMLTLSIFPGSSNSLTASPLFSTMLSLQDLFPRASQALLLLAHNPSACGEEGLIPSNPVQVSLPMTVTLPLRSQGQAYPDDWYAGTFKVSISLPSPLYIPSAVGLLPMDLRIAVDSNMSNYSMKIEPGVTDASFDPTGKSPDTTFGPNLLLLEAARSRSSWWFIYATTFLVPLAFFLLFLHVLFLSKLADKEPLYVTLLNILTMVVTVAAIRQLLIPGDLQGELTRLDLWLGWWGVVLLTLFFLSYAWHSVKRSKRNNI